MHQKDMKSGLYQPRWRRMKEKPPAQHPHAAKKPPQHRVEAPSAWPAAPQVHRIDGLRRG